MKRVMGIEPTYLAWKASVLPLNYTRMRAIDGTRTRDPNLGKVVLHQLSHYRICNFLKCPEPESNQRHMDFQSIALPTELSGHLSSSWVIDSRQRWYITKRCRKCQSLFFTFFQIIFSDKIQGSPEFHLSSISDKDYPLLLNNFWWDKRSLQCDLPPAAFPLLLY